ncbi:hypothetical protein NQ774_14730 [Ochrobactrum sp. BD61]
MGNTPKTPEMLIGSLRAMASIFTDRLTDLGRAIIIRSLDLPTLAGPNSETGKPPHGSCGGYFH